MEVWRGDACETAGGEAGAEILPPDQTRTRDCKVVDELPKRMFAYGSRNRFASKEIVSPSQVIFVTSNQIIRTTCA